MSTECDTDRQDAAFIAGERRALISILRHTMSLLGYDDPEAVRIRWALEREETRVQLMLLGDDLGADVAELPTTIHLSDIVARIRDKLEDDNG